MFIFLGSPPPVLFKENFNLSLAVLSLHCCAGFSVVVAGRVYSSCGLGLPIAMASLVVEHRPLVHWLQ